MKKCLALILSLMLVLGAMPAIAYEAGEYIASAKGNNGPVEVKVVMNEGAIEDIVIVAHAETAGICEPAFDRIPQAIIDGQTLAVDVVSGATNTSKAVIDAVADCVTQAGGDPAAMTGQAEAAPVAEDETIECDVIVVGGGAAGLGAAANAADAGASVTLFEKLSHTGGNTLISGGLIYSTGTSFQQEAGVEDSVEALVEYWQTRAEGHADEALLTLVAEQSAGTIEWLMENGVELGNLGTSGTSPVPRMLATNGGGSGFILPMTEAVKARGVDIRLETPVTQLLTDETGKVVGVEARAMDGHVVTAMAKGGVVLATGGFDASEEMKRKYAPVAADQICYSSVGNEGDGINMAIELGADTVFHNGVIGLRGILPTSFADPANGFVWMPYLLVNAKGERILDETLDYPIYHTKLTEDGSNHFYLIFDATQAIPESFAELAEAGYAFTGDTLEALAEATFMDEATFLATVARYNELKGQEDVDFGKAAAAMAGVGDGPYWAVRVVPTTIGSLGGIKIDLETRVLRPDGQAIEGLFAAGACANGDFFYKEYPASGTSIMMCFTTGRIAGTNAAALAN